MDGENGPSLGLLLVETWSATSTGTIGGREGRAEWGVDQVGSGSNEEWLSEKWSPIP